MLVKHLKNKTFKLVPSNVARNLKSFSTARAETIKGNSTNLPNWASGLAFLTLGVVSGEGYRQYNELHDITKTDGYLEREKELLNHSKLEHYKLVENGFIDLRDILKDRVKAKISGNDNISHHVYYKPKVLETSPASYFNPELQQGIELHYLGPDAANQNHQLHEGIVTHLLDEHFFKVATSSISPDKVIPMFTVNLTTDFNGPNMAPLPKSDSYILFKTQYLKDKSKPYKAVLSSEVYNENDQLIATATCVYVRPKDLSSFK